MSFNDRRPLIRNINRAFSQAPEIYPLNVAHLALSLLGRLLPYDGREQE